MLMCNPVPHSSSAIYFQNIVLLIYIKKPYKKHRYVCLRNMRQPSSVFLHSLIFVGKDTCKKKYLKVSQTHSCICMLSTIFRHPSRVLSKIRCSSFSQMVFQRFTKLCHLFTHSKMLQKHTKAKHVESHTHTQKNSKSVAVHFGMFNSENHQKVRNRMSSMSQQ